MHPDSKEERVLGVNFVMIGWLWYYCRVPILSMAREISNSAA